MTHTKEFDICVRHTSSTYIRLIPTFFTNSRKVAGGFSMTFTGNQNEYKKPTTPKKICGVLAGETLACNGLVPIWHLPSFNHAKP